MINVVWLKRDFRLNDHAPLYYSQKHPEPTLFLYVIEPSYWQLEDTSARQFTFISESIRSYAKGLEKLGGFLCVRRGDVVDVLSKIHHKYPIRRLFCHQETGNNWTFKRDKAVFSWCREKNVQVFESKQQAVFRGKLNRDHWQALTSEWIESDLLSVPSKVNSLLNFHSGLHLLESYPGNDVLIAKGAQQGGINKANSTLQSFFEQRIKNYLFGISSPVKSITCSSRLSPYLCYGVLSLRAVIQQASELQIDRRHKSGFLARLYWHSHFMQKLESDTSYETHAVHRSLVGLRKGEFDHQNFERWKNAQTGVPFVDACMRMLLQCGWINFRMRAMLVAYASYHLWLDWTKTAAFLASTFVDYEPGIHYPQVQMQSGTTGINPFRIYNPVTQGQRFDPKGEFIRRYVPELSHVPDCFVHTPWLYPSLKTDCYDKPALLPDDAARQAKQRITQYYKIHVNQSETHRVIKKHASRRNRQSKKPKLSNHNNDQLSLF
ncbi:deoxyribodipyrimidine photo-lyase [Pseudoalteromonas sp. A25]|uniref:FAD-binding domain-containing protein n=1 Tax=Pseudoalteromonas sp. A25 TaxID=116092 RepID=UPI0012607640|nr:FAD-binding domain-containing protein [Pseudoalteromonas sp. A25]BBN83958.1 deoxyribodipyrimidine photo-lyase [Pseudoalteromonas sp. A25]